MSNLVLGLIIIGPILFGILAWLIKSSPTRSAIAFIGAIVTAAGGVTLAVSGTNLIPEPRFFASSAVVFEALIILLILGIGFRRQSMIVVLLSIAQILMLVFEHVKGPKGPVEPASFIIDPLSIILVLIISIIGSAIVVYAIGYMKRHEEHAPATAASTGRFFFFLIGFLGMMNGLVLTDNLKWLSIFWEATTLCSFFLIEHDGTAESRRNARLALILNTVGGAALSLASMLAVCTFKVHTLSALLCISAQHQPIACGILANASLMILPLIILATLTKSAQMPFQSWLLGAMVAPTPVSALLHSSTMVKAGSYLILRIAPSFSGSTLATVVALAGAFTFALTSALAIGQSNSKRVLAYSTIANLGLIVACAGINTPLAVGAALVILIFHAITKALLFLCVGTIEQQIGSRQIEDMSGIMFKMPLTTTIAVVGMVSMIMPPFGMMIGKWLAIEASAHIPAVLFFIVTGSALTVVFWAKWIGRIITSSYHEKYKIEMMPGVMSGTMLVIIAGVVLGGLTSLPIYQTWIAPIARAAAQYHSIDSFMVWPVIAILAAACLLSLIAARSTGKEHLRQPYLCGENVSHGEETYEFTSLMDQSTKANVASYYFTSVFGENTLTMGANFIALMIIITLFAKNGIL